MNLRVLLFALLVWVYANTNAQTSTLAQYLESCPFLSDTDKRLASVDEAGQSNTLDVAYELKTSELSSCSIRLYPMINGTPLIGVIERIEVPDLDCSLRFYTPDWSELNLGELLSLPNRRQFLYKLQGDESVEAERLRQLLYPLHYDIRWQNNGALSVAAACPFSEEDKQNEALQSLFAQLPVYVYEWRKYRFELKR